MELTKVADRSRINTSQHVLAKRDYPDTLGNIDRKLIELAKDKRIRQNVNRLLSKSNKKEI